MEDCLFDRRLAAAYVRGNVLRTGAKWLMPEELTTKKLDSLSVEEIQKIIEAGKVYDLHFHRFREDYAGVARNRFVLDFLHSICFNSVLVVGSGRGSFLYPLLAEFQLTEITAIDLLAYRIELLQDLTRGGIDTLTALTGDICNSSLGQDAMDIVTLLEVLKHVSDVPAAIKVAVGTARKYVVVSVTQEVDDDPNYVQSLSMPSLSKYFNTAGVTKLKFERVKGSLILIASVS